MMRNALFAARLAVNFRGHREKSATGSHRSHPVRSALCASVIVLVASGASAQVIKSDEWRTGTTLAGFVGAATGSETRAATGAALGWELLPHLTIDGSGIWTVPHREASTFTALVGVRVNLTPPHPVVPFASGGIGLHRATFDSALSNVPDFYRRRMTSASGQLRLRYAFDDFAYSAGAGVDVFLRRHIALRPDVRLLFIANGGNTRTVTVYGLHLAYHFEEHPITP